MENNVFTIDWWNENLQLNEVSSDQDIIDKIIKGFNLVRFPKGFGNAYTTKKGKATKALGKRIGVWVKKNFPNSKVMIRFETTFSTINLDAPSSINESELPQHLNESQTATIGEFIKYACKDLGIQKFPSRLTLSYDTDAAREKRSFGYFDPNNNQIWVYVKNRNMADILRTLAHELVHRKQDEDGRIDYESGETGSDIENEANAKAGVLLRDYGKVDNGIYEAKEYGDHLFGGKDTGVAIKWYSSEIEPDTSAEKALFDFLQKYADSENENYTSVNLDPYYNTFKLIKNEYPKIGNTELLNSMYVYRGTVIDKDKLDDILKKEYIKYDPSKTTIIPDQTYSSSRKISSWSITYDTAHWFAINQKLSKYSKDPNKIPVVMRGIGKDTEPYFNMTFMNKLSNTNENEFLNAANPMPVDIMVLKKEDWEIYSGGEDEDNTQMKLVYK
jgi:Zn-dependent peptidase ImmA (M78 family)